MLRTKYFSALCLLPALMLSGAPIAYADDNATLKKWNPWVDAEVKMGNNRSLGIVDAFAPVWQDQDSLIFFNPRFRFDDQDSQEYNFGIGYRTLTDDWVLGIYGYADRNVSPSGNAFHQITLGAEALGTDWKFRVNNYQPFGDRRQIGTPSVVATGGTLMISGGIETGLRGNDIEAGYRLPMHEANDKNQFWVYGSFYHFSAGGVDNITGPRLRAEYEIGGMKLAERDVRMRLSGEIQHDSVRDTNAFAGIRIGIPFGGSSSRPASSLSPLERHMIAPVERDVDIVVGKSLEAAINPLSGNPVSSVNVLRYSDEVQARIDAAGDDSVIVFDGSNGDFVDSGADPDPMVISPFTMHDGQVFATAGGSVLLRGANSGVTATYNPGGTPAIFNGIEWIELARNNAISGLTFTNGTNTIIGTDVGNFSLTHSTMTGSNSVSSVPVDISVSTPTTITIDNNSFLGNTVGAVRVHMDAGVTSAQLNYTNNIATNNGTGSQGAGLGSAFTILATGNIGATNLTMSGNTVTGNDGNGFYAHTSGAFSSFTGTFTDNDFSNNGGSAIVHATDATNASFTIRGNNLSGGNDNGLAIIASDITNLDLVVDDNQINDITGSANGIAVYGVSNQLNMQITNNNISNNEGTAIINYNGVFTPDITAVISNNTIQNNQNLATNAASGIDIEFWNSLDLTIDSNVFTNNSVGTYLGTNGSAPAGATNVAFTNNSLSAGNSFIFQFDGTGCATLTGNNSANANAYNLYNNGAGTFTLAPTNYAAVNTGGFNTLFVTPAASCP